MHFLAWSDDKIVNLNELQLVSLFNLFELLNFQKHQV